MKKTLPKGQGLTLLHACRPQVCDGSVRASRADVHASKSLGIACAPRCAAVGYGASTLYGQRPEHLPRRCCAMLDRHRRLEALQRSPPAGSLQRQSERYYRFHHGRSPSRRLRSAYARQQPHPGMPPSEVAARPFSPCRAGRVPRGRAGSGRLRRPAITSPRPHRPSWARTPSPNRGPYNRPHLLHWGYRPPPEHEPRAVHPGKPRSSSGR